MCDIFRRGTTFEEFASRGDLAFRHAPLPAADPPQLLRGSQSGTSPLGDELTFHLRKARHHVEEKASRRGLRADAVAQAFEVGRAFDVSQAVNRSMRKSTKARVRRGMCRSAGNSAYTHICVLFQSSSTLISRPSRSASST